MYAQTEIAGLKLLYKLKSCRKHINGDYIFFACSVWEIFFQYKNALMDILIPINMKNYV